METRDWHPDGLSVGVLYQFTIVTRLGHKETFRGRFRKMSSRGRGMRLWLEFRMVYGDRVSFPWGRITVLREVVV